MTSDKYDQPKSTTGEWTAAYVVKFLGLHSKHTEAASFLADAHNAALAAERENTHQAEMVARVNAVELLQKKE